MLKRLSVTMHSIKHCQSKLLLSIGHLIAQKLYILYKKLLLYYHYPYKIVWVLFILHHPLRFYNNLGFTPYIPF